VVGVRALDALGRRTLDIEARVTINATGAGVDRLLDPLNASTRMPMLKAMNLVTRREAGDAALGGRAASGRNLFLVPWRGRALFGTWESAGACSPDDRGVATTDVAAFIAEINEAFPSVALGLSDVTLVHRGVVPATCLTCHNGSAASARPSGHFATTRSCDSCHRMTSWLPPMPYRHLAPGYSPHPGVACVTCHKGNSEMVVWRFPAAKPDCAGCHQNMARPGLKPVVPHPGATRPN
jgi:hypothetical protein